LEGVPLAFISQERGAMKRQREVRGLDDRLANAEEARDQLALVRRLLRTHGSPQAVLAELDRRRIRRLREGMRHIRPE